MKSIDHTYLVAAVPTIDFGYSILFCTDPKLIERERNCLYQDRVEQDAMFINDHKLMGRRANHFIPFPTARPNTTTTGNVEIDVKLTTMRPISKPLSALQQQSRPQQQQSRPQQQQQQQQQQHGMRRGNITRFASK